MRPSDERWRGGSLVDAGWLRVLAGAFAVCAWPASSTASEPARHRCAAVANDLERLACYDEAFGRPEAVEIPPTQAAPPGPPPGSAGAVPIPPTTAVSGAAVADGPDAVPGIGAEADFGLSKWAKRKLDPEARRTIPHRITARVRQVGQQRDGRFVVTLDNDQVWLQSETMSRARVAVDDEVTIREASLGSFLLVTTDDVATRVRRVK
jgi:hypothetical protein